MARNLTPEEIEVFRYEFEQFDIDKGGRISVEEFGRVIRASNKNIADEEIAKIIREVDMDGDGTISFNEFIKMMTGALLPASK